MNLAHIIAGFHQDFEKSGRQGFIALGQDSYYLDVIFHGKRWHKR